MEQIELQNKPIDQSQPENLLQNYFKRNVMPIKLDRCYYLETSHSLIHRHIITTSNFMFSATILRKTINLFCRLRRM